MFSAKNIMKFHVEIAGFYSSTNHRSQWMRMAWNASLHFGDVSLWPLKRRASSSHSRSMVSEEHDQIVFSRKTTAAQTEWNAHLRHSDFPPIAFKSGLHLSIRPIVWRGSRQQWQRAPPPVFITADFPDGGKSFCTCSRNRGVAEKEVQRQKERGGGGWRREEGEREDKNKREEWDRDREYVSVLLCVVLYKPTTTVRLPLLCRELITNPIARPPSYLDPTRLTFSTLSSWFSSDSSNRLLICTLDRPRFLLNSHLRYCDSD